MRWWQDRRAAGEIAPTPHLADAEVTRDGDVLAIAEAKTCHRALERSDPVAPGFVRIRAGRSNLSDQPQRHTSEPATINPVLFGQTPDTGLFVELVHQIQQRLLGQPR